MLAVRDDGQRDAPPIVLLHAIATSSELWSAQVAPLAVRHRVIRVDLPGHGASPPLRPGASFEGYADAVADALDAHGVGRCTLAGLSFGAMVALQLATRRPEQVERLVLACCAVRTPPPVAAMWRERADAVAASGMAGQVAGTLDRWFTPAFAAASPATLAWVGGLIRGTSGDGFTAAAAIISELDQVALLGQVPVPCLVVAGEHDQAAAPGMMQGFASALPNSRFVTLPAAHLACVEAPVAFTEALAAFAAA
jgi:3-oxoadipate enol-lactonase